MLASQDKPFHACRLNRLAPLIGVLRRGIEDGRGLFPVAPFLVGKGVDGIMHKGIKLHFLNYKLSIVGHDGCV